MTKSNNIIEINGQRYNASTGALLQHTSVSKKAKSIDGVKAHASHATVQYTTSPRKIAISATSAAPVDSAKHTVKRSTAHPTKSHQPEPAKTLMRHVVKKPVVQPKSSIKARGHKHAVTAVPASELAAKLSVQAIDKKRLQHAQTIAKSKQVTRFSSSIPATTQQFIAPSPVAAPVQFAPQPPTLQAPHQAKTVDSLFDNALRKADAHRQAPHKQSRRHKTLSRRVMSISGVTFAAVLLIGVVAYQNIGNLSLLKASSKAGFTASLPAYRPAGYSMGDLDYNTGQVAIKYHSNSNDSRAYVLTETPSNWDSSTLRDSFVSTVDANYQSVESAGRTIFLYGNGNATWVNNGIQYTIQGNSSLTTKQLVSLATSL